MSHGTRFALLCCGLCTTVAFAAPEAPRRLERVTAARLCTDDGRIDVAGAHTLRTASPGMRATVAGDASRVAELVFRYLGPSDGSAPLANGELRRQIGLKLRAKDSCNVVYVMWHVEPTSGIFASVKRNPGAATHEQCGAGGYTNLPNLGATQPRPLRVGEWHRLRAEIDGSVLRVTADGVPAWERPLPPQAFEFDGPAGVRSDNGDFEFELLLPAPAKGPEPRSCPH